MTSLHYGTHVRDQLRIHTPTTLTQQFILFFDGECQWHKVCDHSTACHPSFCGGGAMRGVRECVYVSADGWTEVGEPWAADLLPL